MPSLSSAEADFGVHTVLLALRDLAKGMAGVPGRKTLVMLTAGFVLNSEYESEITAAIDTCNKSNVAIYPIDVRGLVAPVPTGPTVACNNQQFPTHLYFWFQPHFTLATTNQHSSSRRLRSRRQIPRNMAELEGVAEAEATAGRNWRRWRSRRRWP